MLIRTIGGSNIIYSILLNASDGFLIWVLLDCIERYLLYLGYLFMGDLREQGGGAAAAVESPLGSLSTSITSNSSPPPSIGPESWGRAEKAIQKIILKVQPTKLSEERRKEVIEYVQRLMKSCNGCEVRILPPHLFFSNF